MLIFEQQQNYTAHWLNVFAEFTELWKEFLWKENQPMVQSTKFVNFYSKNFNAFSHFCCLCCTQQPAKRDSNFLTSCLCCCFVIISLPYKHKLSQWKTHKKITPKVLAFFVPEKNYSFNSMLKNTTNWKKMLPN